MTIDENTKVSLAIVITLTGGMAWVTYLAFHTEANAQAVREMRAKQELETQILHEMRTDIQVIRTKVEYIDKQIREELGP